MFYQQFASLRISEFVSVCFSHTVSHTKPCIKLQNLPNLQTYKLALKIIANRSDIVVLVNVLIMLKRTLAICKQMLLAVGNNAHKLNI